MDSIFFTRSEFKCKCGNCDFDAVDIELLHVLEDMRDHFDSPITINSACRCKEHNESIGGGTKSQHLYGKAADIVVRDVMPNEVHYYLTTKYPNSKGIGNYNSFTHIDVRKHKARWYNR